MPFPTPLDLGLPPEAVVAVPADGLPLYRLIRSETPLASDFAPVAPERAAVVGLPELLRVGLSHYLEPWQAEAVRAHCARMYLLVDDHGERLGEFEDRGEAIHALEQLVQSDRSAAEDCAIVELDRDGHRTGEPLTNETSRRRKDPELADRPHLRSG